MSEIYFVLKKLKGTQVFNILCEIEKSYKNLEKEQKKWYKKSQFFCPKACGKCCHNFEPDILESEALYMAAWLIQNQYQNALKISNNIFPYKNASTCPFFDFKNPHHCSIYGGRAYICRLFGASCSSSKTQEKVWKPCKFISTEKLKEYNPNLEHKEYKETEAKQILKELPPLMSEKMAQALSFTPNNEKTILIHNILPETISKLLWLIELKNKNKFFPFKWIFEKLKII